MSEEEKWRQLCQLAANETDPQRLSELVDQLIRALDARRRAFYSSRQQQKHASSRAADN
jgi:hypothetical protein